jgi:hypothetical protein
LGSGYRGMIEQLTPESRERVRSATDGWLQANAVGAVGAVGAVETNVLYAVARGAAPWRGNAALLFIVYLTAAVRFA